MIITGVRHEEERVLGSEFESVTFVASDTDKITSNNQIDTSDIQHHFATGEKNHKVSPPLNFSKQL